MESWLGEQKRQVETEYYGRSLIWGLWLALLGGCYTVVKHFTANYDLHCTGKNVHVWCLVVIRFQVRMYVKVQASLDPWKF